MNILFSLWTAVHSRHIWWSSEIVNESFSNIHPFLGAGHRLLPAGGPGRLCPDSEVRVQERGRAQPAQDRVPGNDDKCDLNNVKLTQ